MNISEQFKQHMLDSAYEYDIYDLYEGKGEPVEKIFKKLLQFGKKGELVKCSINGKNYYSCMTEDEMYRQFSGGLSRGQFESKENFDMRDDMLYEVEKEIGSIKYSADKERIKLLEERRKRLCERALDEKLPYWTFIIEALAPDAQLVLQGAYQSLKKGDFSVYCELDKYTKFLKETTKDWEKIVEEKQTQKKQSQKSSNDLDAILGSEESEKGKSSQKGSIKE